MAFCQETTRKVATSIPSGLGRLLNIFNKDLFIYFRERGRERQRGREGERQRSSICRFTPQVTIVARAEHLKPGAYSFTRVSHVMVQALRLSCTAFPGHFQGAGLKVEKLECALASVRDSSVVMALPAVDLWLLIFGYSEQRSSTSCLCSRGSHPLLISTLISLISRIDLAFPFLCCMT